MQGAKNRCWKSPGQVWAALSSQRESRWGSNSLPLLLRVQYFTSTSLPGSWRSDLRRKERQSCSEFWQTLSFRSSLGCSSPLPWGRHELFSKERCWLDAAGKSFAPCSRARALGALCRVFVVWLEWPWKKGVLQTNQDPDSSLSLLTCLSQGMWPHNSNCQRFLTDLGFVSNFKALS